MPTNVLKPDEGDQANRLNLFSAAIAPHFLSKAIIDNYSLRYAYGTDASFYRLVPKLVLMVDNEQQIIAVLAAANQFNIAITFRAAGTSLSGQAITDSVLVVLTDSWNGIKVTDLGNKISLQPSVIGAKANRVLAPYQRKIGPDPASINSCKIGGIAANNASGMCCGVAANSYHTMTDMKLVLANGASLDTRDVNSRTQFIADNNDLLTQLAELSAQIKNDPELSQLIQHKYRLKNTTGYGLNALLDFTDPVEMLSHLMIGSEGTLGFISEITYQTVVEHQHKATGLFAFSSIKSACQLVEVLAAVNVAAIEIMDYQALSRVKDKDGMPVNITDIGLDGAALLIELSEVNQSKLDQAIIEITAVLAAYQDKLVCQQSFTTSAKVSQQLWNIRKGMFPAVGAKRPLGTTVIIEDVAFPLPRLAAGVAQLKILLAKFHYDEAIIFGHALAGNLHFVFTQSFNTVDEIERYQQFMAELAQLVAIDFSGSLKAEHGTGRNMAPFVQLEWGHKAYLIMCQLKQLLDPNNILNPGVIINPDPTAHIKSLKALPAANNQIDDCIECGFCEVVCPSKNLTLTPRQRIVLWRRIQQLAAIPIAAKTSLQRQEYEQLLADFQYLAVDSCAATGLCAQQCPVGIDTGQFIKTLRGQKSLTNAEPNTSYLASQVGKYLPSTMSLAKTGLSAINFGRKIFGDKLTQQGLSVVAKLSSAHQSHHQVKLPKPAQSIKTGIFGQGENTVVYVPSCANRVFAPEITGQDQRPLPQVVISLLNKAGYKVLIPQGFDKLCCGLPWRSKGQAEQAQNTTNTFVDSLYRASANGRYTVVTDASPCALTLKTQQKITVIDVVDFIASECLTKLNVSQTSAPVMLHVTCSSRRNQLAEQQTGVGIIAAKCSSQIIEPDDIHCCGFAGDKGFTTPQLNASALATLQQQVPKQCRQGVSNSRTCEIGLTSYSGVPYQSVLYLLDKLSSAKR